MNKKNNFLEAILKDNEATSGYLTDCIQKNNLTCFANDLQDIMQARNITIEKLSKKTKLSIERISEILFKDKDPKLSEFIIILNALNLKLAIEPLKIKK